MGQEPLESMWFFFAGVGFGRPSGEMLRKRWTGEMRENRAIDDRTQAESVSTKD